MSQALQNLRTGAISIITLTNASDVKPKEKNCSDRQLVTSQALQNGGTRITLTQKWKHRHRPDVDCERPAAGGFLVFDLSEFPLLRRLTSPFSDPMNMYPFGSKKYVLQGHDGDWNCERLSVVKFGDPTYSRSPLGAISAIAPESTPLDFRKNVFFNKSAKHPFLSMAHAIRNGTTQPNFLVRTANLRKETVLSDSITTSGKVLAVHGEWVLSRDLGNLLSGKSFRLPSFSSAQLNANWLVLFNTQSGEIMHAKLTREATRVAKQLTASAAVLQQLRGSVVVCVTGRIAVFHAKADESAYGALESDSDSESESGSKSPSGRSPQRLVFVDFRASPPAVLATLACISASDSVHSVQALDATMFLVQRSRNADLIDLLCRPIKPQRQQTGEVDPEVSMYHPRKMGTEQGREFGFCFVPDP